MPGCKGKNFALLFHKEMIGYPAFGSPALSLVLRFPYLTDEEVEGLQCVQGHVARAGWGLSPISPALWLLEAGRRKELERRRQERKRNG